MQMVWTPQSKRLPVVGSANQLVPAHDLNDSFRRDACRRSRTSAGAAEGHGMLSAVPKVAEHRHTRAGLVLGDQPVHLVWREPPLPLPGLLCRSLVEAERGGRGAARQPPASMRQTCPS